MADTKAGPLAHLARLRERLAQQGHTLLDNAWHGRHARYRFRCAHGHETARTGDHVLRNLIDCSTCEAEAKLARLQQVARQAGGECLSTRYSYNAAVYRFRCRLGHEFETRGDRALRGSWCPCCAPIQRGKAWRDPTGLARIQEAARKRGGEWLPQPYARMTDAYRFRCAEGHEWAAPGSAVVHGKWCRLCADKASSDAFRRKDGLNELRRIAQEHGGQCLAHHYENARARYQFRCAQGHEWATQGWSVFRGAWCLKCANSRNKLGIETMREMAAERGGRCLSDTYVNVVTKLEWECARGHRWHSTPRNIRAGHWCAQCSHLSKIARHKTRLQRRYEAVEV
ncbi:hypothetical protein [Ralstonia pseudosolanacearum]|uniref:hypothetical protein n=1 Tax=Ralstonia pseudosolanacearum TaxID=1310165 RepID=UPI003CFB4CC1